MSKKNSSNSSMNDDDEVVDLLEVVKPGRAVKGGRPDSGDFNSDLDEMLDGMSDAGSKSDTTARVQNPTPVDHEVNLNETLEMPEMGDLDKLLAKLGSPNADQGNKEQDVPELGSLDFPDLDALPSSSAAAAPKKNKAAPPPEAEDDADLEAILFGGAEQSSDTSGVGLSDSDDSDLDALLGPMDGPKEADSDDDLFGDLGLDAEPTPAVKTNSKKTAKAPAPKAKDDFDSDDFDADLDALLEPVDGPKDTALEDDLFADVDLGLDLEPAAKTSAKPKAGKAAESDVLMDLEGLPSEALGGGDDIFGGAEPADELDAILGDSLDSNLDDLFGEENADSDDDLLADIGPKADKAFDTTDDLNLSDDELGLDLDLAKPDAAEDLDLDFGESSSLDAELDLGFADPAGESVSGESTGLDFDDDLFGDLEKETVSTPPVNEPQKQAKGNATAKAAPPESAPAQKGKAEKIPEPVKAKSSPAADKGKPTADAKGASKGKPAAPKPQPVKEPEAVVAKAAPKASPAKKPAVPAEPVVDEMDLDLDSVENDLFLESQDATVSEDVSPDLDLMGLDSDLDLGLEEEAAATPLENEPDEISDVDLGIGLGEELDNDFADADISSDIDLGDLDLSLDDAAVLEAEDHAILGEATELSVDSDFGTDLGLDDDFSMEAETADPDLAADLGLPDLNPADEKDSPESDLSFSDDAVLDLTTEDAEAAIDSDLLGDLTSDPEVQQSGELADLDFFAEENDKAEDVSETPVDDDSVASIDSELPDPADDLDLDAGTDELDLEAAASLADSEEQDLFAEDSLLDLDDGSSVAELDEVSLDESLNLGEENALPAQELDSEDGVADLSDEPGVLEADSPDAGLAFDALSNATPKTTGEASDLALAAEQDEFADEELADTVGKVLRGEELEDLSLDMEGESTEDLEIELGDESLEALEQGEELELSMGFGADDEEQADDTSSAATDQAEVLFDSSDEEPAVATTAAAPSETEQTAEVQTMAKAAADLPLQDTDDSGGAPYEEMDLNQLDALLDDMLASAPASGPAPTTPTGSSLHHVEDTDAGELPVSKQFKADEQAVVAEMTALRSALSGFRREMHESISAMRKAMGTKDASEPGSSLQQDVEDQADSSQSPRIDALEQSLNNYSGKIEATEKLLDEHYNELSEIVQRLSDYSDRLTSVESKLDTATDAPTDATLSEQGADIMEMVQRLSDQNDRLARLEQVQDEKAAQADKQKIVELEEQFANQVLKTETLEQQLQSFMANVDKMAAEAAAKVIREELSALLRPVQ